MASVVSSDIRNHAADAQTDHASGDMQTLQQASYMVAVTMGYKITELALIALLNDHALNTVISHKDIQTCNRLSDYAALLARHRIMNETSIAHILKINDAREQLQFIKERSEPYDVSGVSKAIDMVLKDVERVHATLSEQVSTPA